MRNSYKITIEVIHDKLSQSKIIGILIPDGDLFYISYGPSIQNIIRCGAHPREKAISILLAHHERELSESDNG